MGLTAEPTVSVTPEYVESLNYPSQEDVRYSPSEWADVLSELSPTVALELREQVTDPFVQDVLSGASAMMNSDEELLCDVLQVDDEPAAEVNGGFLSRVENRVASTFECLPLVTGSLLCGWIEEITVYTRDYYKNNVRDSIGYYHPEEHYIEIASDASDPMDNWPRFGRHGDRPDFSTTIHEIGHALHYMNGVRVADPDTFDSNEFDEMRLNLQSGIKRSAWQDEFLWDGIEGYANIWSGRYDTLRAFSKQQKATLEEYYAVAFEAWVTAPTTLYEEQPVAWRAFQRLC